MSDDNATSSSPESKAQASRLTDLAPGELWTVLVTGTAFFCLLASYSLMRPVRDAFATANVDRIHLWFTGTLVASLIVVPIFWWLMSRMPKARAVLTMVGLLLGMMAGFMAGFILVPEAPWLRFAFYAWLSMYVMFVLSLFWSVTADVISYSGSKRVYGYIAMGGTMGAISASLTVRYGSEELAALAEARGVTAQAATVGYLAVAMILLLIGGLILYRLLRRAPTTEDRRIERHEPSMRSVWEGLGAILRSRYLMGIALYVVGLTATATLFYKAQLLVAQDELSTQMERTWFFADIWLYTQVITLIIELFLTGKVLRWLGVGIALALLPLVVMGGLAALALLPALSTIMIIEVVRKATNYSLAKPARESLFTVVTPAEKYQAKSFLDTVLYRASDQFSIWILAFFADGMNLPLETVIWLAFPCCALWLVLGLSLGSMQRRQASRQASGQG